MPASLYFEAPPSPPSHSSPPEESRFFCCFSYGPTSPSAAACLALPFLVLLLPLSCLACLLGCGPEFGRARVPQGPAWGPPSWRLRPLRGPRGAAPPARMGIKLCDRSRTRSNAKLHGALHPVLARITTMRTTVRGAVLQDIPAAVGMRHQTCSAMPSRLLPPLPHDEVPAR